MAEEILAGSRYGHLTVLGEVERDRKGFRQIECRCDCGRVVRLRPGHLYSTRRHCSQQCALLSDLRMNDLAGQRFGRWLVLGKGEKLLLGGRLRQGWQCKCDCGTERNINGEVLLSGESTSCGCYNLELLTRHKTPEAKLAAKREASRKNARKNPARMKANKIKYETKKDRATPSMADA